jgi:glycerol-3-phosphate O-acyltransferase 3/4
MTAANILEHVIIIAVAFLFQPILYLCGLVVILAIFGKSLGVRRLYVYFLLRLFEWASGTIRSIDNEDEEEADDSYDEMLMAMLSADADSNDDGQDASRVEVVDGTADRAGNDTDHGGSHDSDATQHDASGASEVHSGSSEANRQEGSQVEGAAGSDSAEERTRDWSGTGGEPLIRRDALNRFRKMSTAAPSGSRIKTVVNDSFDFLKAGMETIIDDEVTSRFETAEIAGWNLLTRNSHQYQFLSFQLTVIWCLAFVFRYFILFPGRLFLALVGLTLLIICTTFIGYMPFGRVKKWLNRRASLMCYRILSRAVSAIVTFHNLENKPRNMGICVANHTSPIDVLILSCDNCYSLVGQRHGGILGFIQRAVDRAESHIWFERGEAADRVSVTERLKKHVENSRNLPILIFPEGTCVNNTSVMQFKKGSFEISPVIYPVAMKYDNTLGDAFWNSSRQSMLHYLLRMMTSWAIVCEVWYLPAMTRGRDESAIDFANRVKKSIARAGGMVDLEWDGQLKRQPVKQSLVDAQRVRYSRYIQRAWPLATGDPVDSAGSMNASGVAVEFSGSESTGHEHPPGSDVRRRDPITTGSRND